MIRSFALIAVLLGALAPAASAQSGDDAYGTPAFEAFLESHLMERLRREAVQRSISLHAPECVTIPELELVGTRPVEPVSMVESAVTPTRGIWQEQIFATFCEETAVENMVHSFSPEGQRTFLLARGRTRAQLETQLGLIGIAIEMAMSDNAAEGCDIGRVADTYVIEEVTDHDWIERWEVQACDRRIDLDIAFDSSSPRGTTFDISVVD